MHRLKQMKEQLVSCVQGQMTNLAQADTEEMGAAIDMIKDLEQAMYYCTLVKAMEDHEKEEKEYHRSEYRDLDRERGRMYYSPRYPEMREGNWHYPMGEEMMPYKDKHKDGERSGRHGEYPTEMLDHREGTSPIHRKYNMEAKELRQDKKMQIEELEKYMHELSSDITEMISGASPEETALLKQKLVTLIEKIK